MEIVFHDKLYTKDLSGVKTHFIKRAVGHEKFKFKVYLVALPIGENGTLEIYWYPELLQKAYKELDRELYVVGVAKSREDAFELVADIIKDVGVSDGNVPVKKFFDREDDWYKMV